jgi:hypothetical protein
MSSTNLFANSVYWNPLKRLANARAMQEQAEPNELDHATPLSGMLFAAIVAALMVVAEQLISTWADGHLLVVWVCLWMAVFIALALSAPSLRQIATYLTAPRRFFVRDHAEQPTSHESNRSRRSLVTHRTHEIYRGKNDE